MKATPKPCNECPFRRKSMKGYLGPWPGPEALILQAHSEAGFACHKTVHEAGEWSPTTRVCAGSLINANKSHKTYRDAELRKLQREATDPQNEVMDFQEFIQYHKR